MSKAKPYHETSYKLEVAKMMAIAPKYTLK